jgi:hypothetical protein
MQYALVAQPGPDYVWDPATGTWKKKRTTAAKPTVLTNPYTEKADKYLEQYIAANTAANQPIDYQKLVPDPDEGEATKWVESLIQQAVNPIEQQRLNNKAQYDYSKEQATTFGQALVMAFSGAKTGAEAEAYAEGKFGSKWAIAAALYEITVPLMAQIQEGFTKSDMMYRDRIAEIFAKKPELLQERLDYLQKVAAGKRSVLELNRKERIESAAALGVIADKYAAQAQAWDTNQLSIAKERNRYKIDQQKLAQQKSNNERLLAEYENDLRQQRYENTRDAQRDAQETANDYNQAGSTYIWEARNGQVVQTSRINPRYIEDQRQQAARNSTATGTIWTVDPKTGELTDTGKPTAVQRRADADDRRADAAAATRASGKKTKKARNVKAEAAAVRDEANAKIGAMEAGLRDGSLTFRPAGAPIDVSVLEALNDRDFRTPAINFLKEQLREIWLDAGATGSLGMGSTRINANINKWIAQLLRSLVVGPPTPR